MKPTIEVSNLNIDLLYGNSFRLSFTQGNGSRRLITLTKGNYDIAYPVNGEKYVGSYKFMGGDLLKSFEPIDSEYPYPYPYPDTDNENENNLEPYTYVIYEGFSGTDDYFDILNLDFSTKYNIMIFEHNNENYSNGVILPITTSFPTNTEKMEFNIYDNITMIPIGGVDISIQNKDKFISDFGKSNETGGYSSLDIQEGRYNVSFLKDGYENKVLRNVFIQRKEPTRDNNYREFTASGNTEFGTTVSRKKYMNKNSYEVYLNPSNTTKQSYTKYLPNRNPSHLTKI